MIQDVVRAQLERVQTAELKFESASELDPVVQQPAHEWLIQCSDIYLGPSARLKLKLRDS